MLRATCEVNVMQVENDEEWIIKDVIATRITQPLFLKILPPVATGFRPAVVSWFVVVGFLTTAAFFAPGFVTIVVAALVLLASLLLPSPSSAAAPRFPTCRLGPRAPTVFVPAWFEDGLIGDRGRVRELFDRGESTFDGAATFREAVRTAFVFAAVITTVRVRFFGLDTSS